MDKLWRFFRTVGWASVGVVAVSALVVPVLDAMNVGDFVGVKQAVVIGGLTVLGAGLLAVLQGLISDSPTTVLHRVVNQFAQTAIAGLVAPVLADTLLDTAVNYGRSIAGVILAALVAAAQAWAVNAKEASAVAVTPAPAPRKVA
jgi:hypothetical protein